jgi:hypothetical protein
MVKESLDADQQALWLERTRAKPGVEGVRPVRVLEQGSGSYVMELLSGRLVADIDDPGTLGECVTRLIDQVAAWASAPADNDADWESYLRRLSAHAEYAQSDVARRAVDLVRDLPPFPRSWCHGDLTLENVIRDHRGLVLFDPNYSPDLYQSHVLDYGKILQSTHTSFHRLLSPRDGACSAVDSLVERLLRERGVYEQAVQACLTHAVRLLRHWPGKEYSVEAIIVTLLDDLR